MRKILITLILIFFIMISSIYVLLINNKGKTKLIQNYNIEYEEYLNKAIYGTELATLINKAINLNESNKIEKDENNHYIENEGNSIKIDIEMLLTEKTYPMEEIYKNNTEEFVKHFNLEKFKCEKIEYHKKTGKISKMLFKQVEE